MHAEQRQTGNNTTNIIEIYFNEADGFKGFMRVPQITFETPSIIRARARVLCHPTRRLVSC